LVRRATRFKILIVRRKEANERMGIDLYMEDERGAKLADVSDPRGLVGCLISLAGLENTVCLRFIDLYGDTVFNQLQIPDLIRELEAAREFVTDERVAALGQRAVEEARKAGWAPTVIQGIESSNQRLAASEVRSHLERVLDLARRAQGQVHTYLKFYGD
jgi:hypothetical protein